MRRLLLFGLLLGAATAHAVEFSLSSGVVYTVSAQVFSSPVSGITAWTNGAAVRSGELRRIGVVPIVSVTAGTTGTNAVSPAAGRVVSDGAVSWIMANRASRHVCVQKVSGAGDVRVSFGTGYVLLSVSGATVSLSSYDGAVRCVAVGGDAVVSVSEF